jgi:hypothetical protein
MPKLSRMAAHWSTTSRPSDEGQRAARGARPGEQAVRETDAAERDETRRYTEAAGQAGGHALAVFFFMAPSNDDSMNGSRSPSSTAEMLPVSCSVRRSFTSWYGAIT